MAKRIIIYEALGDGTKDRGEKQYLLSLEKDKICKTTNMYKVLETFPFTDIVKVDCYKTDSFQEGNQAAGAAAGMLVAGVAGAAIGSMLNSGQKKSWCVEIDLKDRTVYYRLNRDQDRNTFVKWATKAGLMEL